MSFLPLRYKIGWHSAPWRWLAVMLSLMGSHVMAAEGGTNRGVPEPRVLIPAKGYAPLALPDGVIEHYFVLGDEGRQSLVCIRSRDEGETWTTPEPVMVLPATQRWASRGPQPMLDSRGDLHLFMLEVGGRGQFTWHTKRARGTGDWTSFKEMCKGSLHVPAIQLKTGRMVAAVSYGVARTTWDDPLGSRVSTSYYSDDFGATWQASPVELRIAGFADQGLKNGASLPVIIELKDGRIWMLLRTQTGWLYESYSSDGISWSDPSPTQFRSSDSPACLARLPGGELMVLWNNCSSPDPLDGAWIYTGRDAVHAAVSKDEGATWAGFREIYLDPRRDLPPHKNTDRGTGSPNATVTPGGKVIMAVCERDERVMISFDPRWLNATESSDGFADGLAHWSTFKAVGPVDNYWRNRTTGARLVPHPSRPAAVCLGLRGAAGAEGDGATWNFPAAKSGRLSLRLWLEPGFQGGLIAVTDRFYFPQETDDRKATFALPVGPAGRLAEGLSLQEGRWHEVALEWRLERGAPRGRWPGECVVFIDGVKAMTLPQLNRAKSGASYLRLNATGAGGGGLLLESVAMTKK